MNKYIYIILDSSDSDKIVWKDVIEESLDHVFWNKDKSKFVLKFIGDCPLWGCGRPLYTHEQFKKMILNNAW